MSRGVIQAAGVVLWRPSRDGAGLEVCLVHRPKYDDWSLPKGKVDPGEHLLACAVREVLEETGHRVVLGRPLPDQRYPVGPDDKVVHYWAALADDSAPPWQGTVEIDQAEFLPVPAALERLTHPRDAELVAGVAADPAPTVPLVVLRHGKAMSRSGWTGPDPERPLERRGVAQADRLAVLLGCYGLARIVSSDAARCVDTVRPYATSTRRTVELEPGVSEIGHEQHPDLAAEVVQALLSAAEPTVLCSHRPVLPTLFEAVREHARCDVPAEPTLPPGGFVVLHHRDGIVVAAERHEL
ncbi:MAG TPA: NUDIX domain-containing protein [Jiangellales bacterium]|nr:NUDIX domain-containing protein [Jiangellales bacterium]